MARFRSHYRATDSRAQTWQQLRVSELIAETLESFSARLRRAAIRTDLDIPHHVEVYGCAEPLRTALKELISHAIAQMPQGGELTITVVEQVDGVAVEVADDGPGVEEQLTADRQRRDTTLSLTAHRSLGRAQRVADAHGGAIQVCNCPQGGAAVTLWLPRQRARAAA